MSDEALVEIAGYRIDLLIQGYPGKSTHHGGLGWSTVVLLRGHGRIAVLDTCGPGQRTLLRQRLEALGVAPSDVTDLLLSHPHWDHVANYPMFTAATLHAGETDLKWAAAGGSDVYAVSEPHVRELMRDPRLRLIKPDADILPSLHAQEGPGHTPGHIVFVLCGEAFDVVLAQDAAKSKAELLSGDTDLSIDPAASRATIAGIRQLWAARAGNILIPGHDLPMMHDGAGRCRMLGARQAGISAAFGDRLDERTLFSLVER
jgi:N-acyl homoserine lactone hydrolase